MSAATIFFLAFESVMREMLSAPDLSLFLRLYRDDYKRQCHLSGLSLRGADPEVWGSALEGEEEQFTITFWPRRCLTGKPQDNLLGSCKEYKAAPNVGLGAGRTQSCCSVALKSQPRQKPSCGSELDQTWHFTDWCIAMPDICYRVSLPTAVLVTVTWFCMCVLHMLCQTAENEGVEFDGEAGVFPSLLPDNAPSGAGERLPSTPCQPGNKHTQRLTGKNGMGWELGNDRGRYYLCQNN